MENNIIEADYYPESEKEKFGHVSLNLETEEEQIIMVDGYSREYPRMAISGLERTLKLFNEHQIPKLPKERLVMWY